MSEYKKEYPSLSSDNPIEMALAEIIYIAGDKRISCDEIIALAREAWDLAPDASPLPSEAVCETCESHILLTLPMTIVCDVCGDRMTLK